MPQIAQGRSVLEQALDRIGSVYRAGHRVVVAFSGGKDSVHEDAVMYARVDGRVIKTTPGGLLGIVKPSKQWTNEHGTVFVEPQQVVEVPTATSRRQDQARFEFRAISHLTYHDVTEPLYEIETRTGRRTLLTGDHSVMRSSVGGALGRGVGVSEAAVCDLVVGDALWSLTDYDFEGEEVDHPDWFLRLAGSVVGDGCFVRCRGKYLGKLVVSSGNDPEMIGFLQQIPRTLSGTERSLPLLDEARSKYPTYNAVYCGAVRTHTYIKTKITPKGDVWLCDTGLVKKLQEAGFGGLCRDKRIPEWLYTASRRQIGLFLAGMIDSDGCCTKGSVFISGVNKPLLEGIRELLWRLGVDSGLSSAFHTSGFKPHHINTISIAGGESLVRAMRWIPAWKMRRFTPLTSLRKGYTFKRRTIRSITRTAPVKRRVFDFSVPDNNMFVADGLLLHNSTVILELAVQVAKQHDRLPVEVSFYDEEVIYPGVVEFVERTSKRPEIKLRWCSSHKPQTNAFCRDQPYWWTFDESLQPDDWVRTPPDSIEWSTNYSMCSATSAERFPPPPGKDLVVLMGIRAAEGRNRRMSIFSSRGHMAKVNKWGHRTSRPIFDWTDGDVWKFLRDGKFDFANTYNLLFKLGVSRSRLRIGPPVMTPAGVGVLRAAARAWPQWFSRLALRLPGVNTVAKFGVRAIRPDRRLGETWRECYFRTCVEHAPAWIRERAQRYSILRERQHSYHSTDPLPDSFVCATCYVNGSWQRMTYAMYMGDPMGVVDKGFKAVDPEFFRAGAGAW